MAVLTVYPAVDGYMYQLNSAGDTWAAMRDGAGNGSATGDTVAVTAHIESHADTDKWRLMYRAGYINDTSDIPDAATISEAIFSQKMNAKANTLGGSPTYNVYLFGPAAEDAIANGDYNSLGTTAYSDTAITHDNIDTTNYNNWTFNATGIAAISKTANTKIGIREATYDVADSAPSYSASSSMDISGKYSEQTGTDSDPKLVITYSVGPETYDGAITLTLSLSKTSLTSIIKKTTITLLRQLIPVAPFANIELVI